eukprot:UN29819
MTDCTDCEDHDDQVEEYTYGKFDSCGDLVDSGLFDCDDVIESNIKLEDICCITCSTVEIVDYPEYTMIYVALVYIISIYVFGIILCYCGKIKASTEDLNNAVGPLRFKLNYNLNDKYILNCDKT